MPDIEAVGRAMKKKIFRDICGRIAGFLTGVWAFLMLAVFPLFMKERYIRLGEYKYRFFLEASAVLLPAGACFFLYRAGGKDREGERRFSCLDWAMIFYLAAAAVSWLVSVDRNHAWSGTEGWYMGFRTQFLLVASYFMISRCLCRKKVVFTGHYLASALVFLLGIWHRFGVDPLCLYEGIHENWQLLFLSTVGQASWYSSYVCIVLVIGVADFFLEQRPVRRFFLGCYCVLGFSTVVTQNSDSAFSAMAYLFSGLFLVACDSPDKTERFLETLLLMLGSFKLMGCLRQIFPDRAVQLDGLSDFLAQSTSAWLLFLAVCVVYMLFLIYRQKNPEFYVRKGARLMRRFAAGLMVAVPVCYALAVWLNTTGRLGTWFGIRSTNRYLYFDSSWGNSRGFIWSFTWQAFREFSPFRMLFGVGPDCYPVYCYQEPGLGGQLNHFFGWDQTLTNAHNEFLNLLFCMGMIGLAAFCCALAAAFGRFYKKNGQQLQDAYVLAGMLAVPVYAAHNFFCYQQVCCAPFLFLLLGAAENSVRRKEADLQKNCAALAQDCPNENDLSQHGT